MARVVVSIQTYKLERAYNTTSQWS